MKKLIIVGLVLLIAVTNLLAQKYQVVDLGTLGGDYSAGYAINSLGQVTGESTMLTNSQTYIHAFLYSNGLMQDLGTLGTNSHQSAGQGINDMGQVVGIAYLDAPPFDIIMRAFLYSSNSMQDIGSLGSTRYAEAKGINAYNQIVGTSSTNFNDYFQQGYPHAFLYSSNSMQNIGTLGGIISKGYAITDAGQIVGSSRNADGLEHAFLYSNNLMNDLGTLGGSTSTARGINSDTKIVGYSRTSLGDTHAFIYSNGSMQDIGTLTGGTYSDAYGINSKSKVVGIADDDQGMNRAIIYENGLLKDLNTLVNTNSGWIVETAYGINNIGQIVGSGTDSFGQTHALLLNPLQEGWEVITNQTIKPTYTNLPAMESGKDSLIVVTHGRIPFGDDPMESTAWVYSMTNDISQYLTAHNLNNWQVYGHGWQNKAKVIISGILLSAEQQGVKLGECISTQGWAHVHLIAHSAGAALIQAASEKIKAVSPFTEVQCTFLDPFVGEFNEKRIVYGQGTDWSDHYYSAGDLPLTEAFLPHAYNVDVTKLHKILDRYAFISSGALPSTPCLKTVASHDSPIYFYSNTVTGNTTSEYEGFGFPLSREGGGWDFATNAYHVGNMTPRVLGVPDPNCISFATANVGPGTSVNFSESSSVDSFSGIIQEMGLGLRLVPQSPVWTSVFVTITNVVNFVSFDAAFESSVGSEGLLSVYWDTNVLGSVDEQAVLSGIRRYTLGIPKTPANSLHMLGFRLDSFGGVLAPVNITNVVLGYVGVKEPFSLSVSTNTEAGLPVFELAGEPNFNYTVEASTNLINWSTIAVLVNTNGSVKFTDPGSTNFNQRFYRAVAP